MSFFIQSVFYPQRSQWHLKFLIAFLTLCFFGAHLISSDAPEPIETVQMQAEVVSDPNAIKTKKSVTDLRFVKLRLEDSSHAYVSWNAIKPHQGDTVSVLVKVFDDGSRKVSLIEF